MILLKPHFKCYDFQCDGLYILIILFHVQFKYSKLSNQTDISLSKLLKSLKSMNLRNITLFGVFFMIIHFHSFVLMTDIELEYFVSCIALSFFNVSCDQLANV